MSIHTRIADRLIAYALFAGFILAAALGWDWDSRQHLTGKRGEGDGVGAFHGGANK